MEQAGLAGKVSIDDNYGLIMYNVQGMDSAVQSSLIITCALLISIILGMMMMVVRNTFAISVDEKLQQFGILRCLGASRKSIRSIVGCEAFITWGIAAPVGVAGTIVAMQVILAVVRTIDSELLSGPHAALGGMAVCAGSQCKSDMRAAGCWPRPHASAQRYRRWARCAAKLR